jgi:creatinine amidohydrolase
MDRKKYFELDGDHAEEMETSLLLYLKPDLVLPKSDWGDGREKKHKISAFAENWLWTERKWSKVTDDTGIGNPKFSSREKGEVFFRDVTQKIAEVMIKICNMDTDHCYD